MRNGGRADKALVRATSTLPGSLRKRLRSAIPIAAYIRTTRRALSTVMFSAFGDCVINPAQSDPNAVAKAPVRVYQPNVCVLILSDTIWDSEACSIDRNG